MSWYCASPSFGFGAKIRMPIPTTLMTIATTSPKIRGRTGEGVSTSRPSGVPEVKAVIRRFRLKRWASRMSLLDGMTQLHR